VLVNCPCKFVVQFPCNDGHDHCEEPDDAGHCDQVWLDIRPDRNALLNPSFRRQSLDGFVDLVILNGRIDQHSHIIDA